MKHESILLKFHHPPPFRTKLDLGIVKKSIVVDDVSKRYVRLSHSLNKPFLNCLIVNVFLWLLLSGST